MMHSSFSSRLLRAVVAAAFGGLLSMAVLVGSASAQTCAYNSTQGTCACPTSGAGTSCFGGQLFRSSDNSCQADTRPCATNQQYDCTSEACVCNTASFPCGGCTVASSTIGAACGAPSGGQYTNICSACACPAGKTLCSSGNNCVTNRVCPAGTTWDPCTDTCGTPNVLLSPSFIQSGFIQVNGDVKSTAGNLRMDSATGAGQGDTYIANGKAIRIDGAGVTSLSIGNWGAGGTSADIYHTGNEFTTGGLSTMPGDSAVAANTIETGNICFGNAVNCRSSWPISTDYDAAFVNVGGDTMTGTLTVSGASSNVTVAGNVGIGTAAPNWRLEVSDTDTSTTAATRRAGLIVLTDTGATASGTDYPIALSTTASKSNNAGATARIMGGDFTATNASQTSGTTYTYGVSGTAYGADTNYGAYGYSNTTRGEAYGAYLVGDGTSTNNHYGVRADGRGSGTNLYGGYFYANGTGTNTYGVYLNANSTVGTNYGIYANVTGAPTNYAGIFTGGNVGIGTATPTQALDVNGTAKMTGFQLTTGAGVGKLLYSDASGNGTWQASADMGGSGTANYVPKFTAATTIGNSQIFDNGTAVGIGTAGPAAGVKLDVNGAVKGSTFTNAASPFVSGNLVIQPSAGTAAIVVGTANATQFFQVQNNLGQPALNVDTTNMRVGIGTASSTAALDVSGGALFEGASGSTPVAGAGTRLMWVPAKAALRAGIISGGRTEFDDANIGLYSVAFGLNSGAAGQDGFAEGNNSHANGDYGIAMGLSNTAGGYASIALGNGNAANGISSVAIGNSNTSGGNTSVAFGSGNQATGDYSTAGGQNSVASGNGTVAIGWGAHAAGGVGLGDTVYATGSDSVALGFGSQATNTSATVSGYQSTGSGFATTAMGYNNTASGYAATAFGQSDNAVGDRSVAMGLQNTTNGPGSVALGAYNSTGATGYATAVGYANSAGGQYSFAGGYAATASGDMSFAYGQSPTASGYSSVALGQYDTASATYSAAYGNFLKSTGYKAITIGNGYDGTAGGLLTNSVGYSVMFGSHSNLPTMTVVNSSPGIGTIGNVGIGTTTPSERLEVNGNLKFTPANPYISASSYFVAPGGAYFNSGTVYTEAPIQARGGIHDDTGPTLDLLGGSTGITATSGPMQVNAGSGGYGLQANGTSGTWGPSVGVNNGSQEWRMVSWSGNELKFVKITGTTFTPFTIYNNSYQDELELKSNGISLSGKHAFRSDDSWLRLNQDGAFTSGIHTPGLFAPMSLNVGGYGGWVNPGAGNASIAGDLIAENNSWGSGSGWIYCGANSSCWCPGGEFVIAEINYNYYYGYSYIDCAKP